MTDFRMPSLGADMESGTLVRWRVKPGDTVRRGDVVADVETQKGTVEVEVFQSGVVQALLVDAGAKVPVGTVLATLGDGAVSAAEPATAAPAPAMAPARPLAVQPEAAAGRPIAAPGVPRIGGRTRASPLARRIAAELGVDIASLAGTGEGGVVTRSDVERVATSPMAPSAPAPSAAERAVDRRAAMRQAIATAMSRSNREIPHYYLATDIDMSRAMAWIASENEKRGVAERLLPAALLLRSIALALREVPELNGFWVDDAFHAVERVHLGVAISLRGGGLVAPAIHDADTLGVGDMNAKLRDLVQRARTGALRSSELADPTVTVTNLGDQGARTVFGLIHPPQVALIGFGKIDERPFASGGMLGVRPVVTATLAADHRASDGHRGGIFLAAVDRLLQTPERP